MKNSDEKVGQEKGVGKTRITDVDRVGRPHWLSLNLKVIHG